MDSNQREVQLRAEVAALCSRLTALEQVVCGEDALKRIEHLLAFQAEAPFGFCALDTELRFVFVNDWLARITGLPVEQHLGRKFREIFPDWDALVNERICDVINSGEPMLDRTVALEFPTQRHLRKQFQLSCFPVTFEKGTIEGLNCLVREIGDEKETDVASFNSEGDTNGALSQTDAISSVTAPEADQGNNTSCRCNRTQSGQIESLQQSDHAQLQLITDNLPAMIAYFDSNQRYQFANNRYANVIGLPREQIIGAKVETVLGQRAYESVRRWIEAGLSGQRVNFEMLLPLEFGEDAWLDVTYAPDVVAPNVVRGMYVLGYDISERKRTEETLKHSEARLNAILQTAADAIITITDKKIISSFNRSAEQLFGYSAQEVLGKNVRILVPQPDADRHDSYVDNYLATGQAKIIGSIRELQAVRKDGTLFPIELSISEKCWSGKRGFVGIVRDISERKRVEEEMRKAHEKIIQHQRHETEYAEAKLKELKKVLVSQTQLAIVGQMSTQIAHDLRNPLGAASNAVYYLKRKVPTEESKYHEYLDLIQDEINVCAHIIGDLLDLTRDDTPIREIVNLEKSVRSSLTRINMPSEVTLCFSCNPDPFLFSFDEVKFRRVLDNLFMNSLDALKGTGVISVIARRSEAADEITISDSGPGVLAELREKIFEPFFTTHTKGTGLGLPICRRIIERHGGTIELTDNDKQGTEFKILLPRKPLDD